jgi:DNA excision repair protein ERCC-3
MGVCSDNALVVQSDCSVLLEVHSPRAAKAREAIAHHRKLFLTEQGYSYQVVIADEP